MATSVIKTNKLTTTVTSTTGSTGNIDISSVVPQNSDVLCAYIPSGTYMCVPFRQNNNWYLKVIDWSITAYTVVSNTSVTATVIYTT